MSTSTSLVTGVDFIAVPTQDFEQADAFYADVLGLERSKRWGDMPAGEFETAATLAEEAVGAARTTIDAIDAWLDRVFTAFSMSTACRVGSPSEV